MLAFAIAPPASANPPLTVSISSCPSSTVTGFVGDYPGGVMGSMRQFLGIHYAAAPTGAKRWQPPQTTCWNGNRNAKSFGNVCPQNGIGSEDCLVLNIFTSPIGNISNRPVMVFIHGGSLTYGAGSAYFLNPINLVNQGVIVVTINYRLGALGFLAHAALDNVAAKNTGNYGILDQQAALKWLKANISAFGGNPNNVTIFGPSAGGLSVLTHLVSPLSTDLFHKAIIESGALYQVATPLAVAETQGAAFAAKVGCTSGGAAKQAQCLRALDVSNVLTNQKDLGENTKLLRQDGVVLTDSIRNLLIAGSFPRVPIINGTTHDEWRWHLASDQQVGTGNRCNYTSNLVPVGQDNFPDAVNYHDALHHLHDMPASPNLAALVEGQYKGKNTALNANRDFTASGTDRYFACRALRASNWIAQNGGKIYAYEFNDKNAPQFSEGPIKLHDGTTFPYGASHIAELQYLFPVASNAACGLAYAGLSAKQQQLAAAIVRYWTTFAKTGNPNPASGTTLPHWPRYVGDTSSMLSLVAGSPQKLLASNFDTDHKCTAFWNVNTP